MKHFVEYLKLDRPLIWTDLETTGRNPKKARIVQAAHQLFEPVNGETKLVKEYRTLVNPGMPIPEGSMRVHKITDEMVKDAPRWSDLAANYCAGMRDCDFAGYNVRFDLKVYQAEFDRCFLRWNYDDARIIDPFKLWQQLEPRRLTDAVARWMREHATPEEIAAFLAEGEAHEALWDVKASAHVLTGMLAAGLTTDLNKLHEMGANGWYDADGRLVWDSGELVFGFGDNRDEPLRAVAATERGRGYLKWMLRADFSDKVKQACRDALNGVFPAAPDVAEDVHE